MSTALKYKNLIVSSRLLILSVLFLTSVLTSACFVPAKGYKGRSDSDNVAVLRAHGVTFHTVNGHKVGMMNTGAEVLPGKNELELSLTASNFNAPDTDKNIYKLPFNAESGKEYSVTARRGDGRVCAWEIDPETGEPNFTKNAGCLVRE